jgi:asparagine synthase (glutamine-hydrolysing)
MSSIRLAVLADGSSVTVEGPATTHLGSADRRTGPWARWEWDGRQLQVEVDRYGMYPLFYAQIGTGIAIADSIAALLAAGAATDFDDAAIAAFLRLGFFLGEDTPFLSVRAFPPGADLRWTAAGGVRLTGGPIKRRPDGSATRAELLNGFVDRFRHAVQQALPDDACRCALPLSGGRDSRHIAIEMHAAGFKPGLVVSQHHFSYRNDDDARVAGLLAEALGWSLNTVEQVSEPVGPMMATFRQFDCTTDEHFWFAPAAQRIRDAGMVHVFDGLAGDTLAKGLFVRSNWIDLGQRGDWNGLLSSFDSAGYGNNEASIAALLAAPYGERWNLDLARARFRAAMEPFAGDDNPANLLMFWSRTRREVAPFLIRFLPGTHIITPYLDGAVFDHLWNIPTEILLDRQFRDDGIKLAGPGYAGIPYESDAAHDLGKYSVQLMRGMAFRRRFWSRGRILTRHWLRPRLLRALVQPGAARACQWFAPLAVWLASLEMLADAPTHRSRAGSS